MTPTEQDKKLEVALMELFCRSEEFGRVFLTRVSKEEFAKSVNDGALDHQQAAHEAMQLITADRKRVALEARIQALDHVIDLQDKQFGRWTQMDIANFFNEVGKYYRELKAQQEEV